LANPALKRLERAGQSALYGAARWILHPGRPLPPPDWRARPHRVLYLRYDRIGDMILATGLIRAIATSHAGMRLDVLASPANAPVLIGNPHVDRVLLFDRRRAGDIPRVLRELRAERYDAVIDGMVISPSATMMLLMLASRARYRIGIGGRRNDFVYTLPVPPADPGAHVVEQSARTALPFGVDPARTEWHPELYLRGGELESAEAAWGPRTARRLLTNISAVTHDRQWPLERYEAVLREARALDPVATVAVIAAPGEREVASELAARTASRFVVTPGIRDAFALIATADAVFTPDTSISHAAAALDVPLAVLIPAGSLYGPYGGRHVRIESPGRTLGELPISDALRGLRALLDLSEP
jgi:ADP-heptose:LPS heptosyltransferase